MSERQAKPEDYRRIYDLFQAPIARFDCGKRCAPLNGGEPVCCSTDHALPVVDLAEWQLLKSRSDLWRPHRPQSALGKRLVDALHVSCLAIECKGARHCERDNRTLACRSFPFFPYIDREGRFIGLSIHWTFVDRCWVISNLQIVDGEFRRQFVVAYELLFRADRGEFQVHKEYSATLRRVFSRKRLPIPMIGREGGLFRILPMGGGVVACKSAQLPKFGPFRSKRAYRAAMAESL